MSYLLDYRLSFSAFILKIYRLYRNQNDFIVRLLFSLYLLTYYKVSQPSATDLENFENNIELAANRNKEVTEIIENKNIFEKEYKEFRKKKIFNQKRAWCSLRDFIKSPEFSKYFKNTLENNDIRDYDIFFSMDSFRQLELPGDVWNNNSKFRNCILKNTNFEKNKESFAKLLRKIFQKEKIDIGYPEQFDITFDFVPRMCQNNNCDICVYGKLNGEGKKLKNICVKDKSKFCPICLISCNYQIYCNEEGCNILNIINLLDNNILLNQ